MTQDLRLIFGDRVVVKFTTGSEVKTLTGRWCNVCKKNAELVKKHGTMQKAKVPEHHWAIPRAIWKEMQALSAGKQVEKQANLDGVVQKFCGPREFTREGLRDAITKLIACDDQVSNYYTLIG
ncbi:hypothetical protein EDB84DRAFT_1447632 [Lactarius hengduanensis]|nr:hypothetical protein EDB84DRAFT_1447632 [Lactarius hengduanensis]